MNIIAINGYEITLGCFVNLHIKHHVSIMEYLLKLTTIITLLHIGLLQLMHFNDLCLLFKGFTLLFDSGVSKW